MPFSRPLEQGQLGNPVNTSDGPRAFRKKEGKRSYFLMCQ